MSIAAKIALLLNALTPEDVETLPPAERRRFAELCRHWADRAGPQAAAPKSGVLASLKHGERSL